MSATLTLSAHRGTPKHHHHELHQAAVHQKRGLVSGFPRACRRTGGRGPSEGGLDSSGGTLAGTPTRAGERKSTRRACHVTKWLAGQTSKSDAGSVLK